MGDSPRHISFVRRPGSVLAQIVVAVALLPAVSVAATDKDPVVENRRCLECHGKDHIGELDPEERYSMVGEWTSPLPEPPRAPRPGPEEVFVEDEPLYRPDLYVPADALSGSAHAKLACVECHEDADRLPHEFHLNLSTCADSCHQEQVEQYAESSHAQEFKEGNPIAPGCAECHGGHEILPVGSRQSPQHRLNSIFLCADCHEKHEGETPAGDLPKTHIPAYLGSIHGKAVTKSGLVAAPTCVDCHTAHAVHPVGDARSPMHREAVPETCGTCHVGILDTYQASIHGPRLGEDSEKLPVCTDCHGSHTIVHPDEIAFKLHSDERCGQCHEDRLEHYKETYHGKALILGRSEVAACYDCHGHHDILPVDDPASRLAGENKLKTCQQCHPSAGGMFTSYIAHADHLNAEEYPLLFWTFVFMTAIVVGTWGFFGLHTLLWIIRSSILYSRDPEAFRELKARAAADKEHFVRFRPFERFLHSLVMSSFLLLVATGMPLKFYDTGWAKSMISLIGGMETAGTLHRLGAVITFLYLGLHVASLIAAAIRHHDLFKDPETGKYTLRQIGRVITGPDLPIPNLDDARDFWAHQKWFFGSGPRPQFDRWTYWEKFDYMAVFWGVSMIGFSGLIMWFPELFTYVIPGWTINLALIIHSDEALLAAGFIFAFHFFNVHFRIEKFPIDSVIFSGRISRTEMMHERKRWYDRLEAEGRLDEIRPRDDWAEWRRVIHPIGFLAFGIGMVLLVLILYAMTLRLFGN